MQAFIAFGGGSFVTSVVGGIELCSKDPAHHTLWSLMKYTTDACNTWFRGLWQHGLFVPVNEAVRLIPFGFAIPVSCQERLLLTSVRSVFIEGSWFDNWGI